jgi:N-hydroxyarylamine O-acetyltransferase
VSFDEERIRAYLDRIGLEKKPETDLAGLTLLHRAHLYAIPFENLDIHLGRPLSLDPDDLFAKIVEKHRGGFCYEQNLLLATVLRSMGLAVDLLQAQVRAPDGSLGEPFDHMTLRVHLPEGLVLADVGFGESFHDPLPFDGAWHGQPHGPSYRVVTRDRSLRVERREGEEGEEGEAAAAADAYLFDSKPREPDEYLTMFEHHQSSPESIFTRGFVCSLALPEGRVSVKPWALVETRSGERSEAPITSSEELAALLSSRFGIEGLEIPPDWPERYSASAPSSVP